MPECVSVVVIHNRDEAGEAAKASSRCAICGGRLYYPFLSWERANGGELFICAACCARLRSTFVADLFSCAAVAELQQTSTQFEHRKERIPATGAEVTVEVMRAKVIEIQVRGGTPMLVELMSSYKAGTIGQVPEDLRASWLADANNLLRKLPAPKGRKRKTPPQRT